MSRLLKGGKINIFSNSALKASINSTHVFTTAQMLHTQKSESTEFIFQRSQWKRKKGKMTGQFNF